MTLAEVTLPYAKYAHISGTIGRVLLLAVSYKKPQICKTYFFYELVMLLIDMCMVKAAPIDATNFIQLLTTTIIFIYLYFDIVPSLIGILISQITFAAIRHHLYEETIGALTFVIAKNMGFLVISFLMAHVLVTYAGFLFTESEILHEHLLNQMEEGLIIIEDKTNKVLFQN